MFRTELLGSILGGYLQTFFFINLVEKTSSIVKRSVAKMASTVCETENCCVDWFMRLKINTAAIKNYARTQPRPEHPIIAI